LSQICFATSPVARDLKGRLTRYRQIKISVTGRAHYFHPGLVRS
jgi:hypothetical protein